MDNMETTLQDLNHTPQGIAENVIQIFGQIKLFKKKMLNRLIVLVDEEEKKKEILSLIDAELKQKLPQYAISICRIDLSTVSSMKELSLLVTNIIAEYQQPEDGVKKPVMVNLRPTVIFESDDEKKVQYGYGLIVFDNLELANKEVLEGVKDLYLDGRDCPIPYGWEFISFCHSHAEIFDTRLRFSCYVYPCH